MKKPGVGVAVGRFQVHRLHEGHKHLLAQVRIHQKSLVCIGIRPVICTPHDPLDYPTREQMLKEYCRESVVVPLPDKPSDRLWSDYLDSLIGIMFPTDTVTIYQGRDSFQGRYLGKHRVVEVEEVPFVSGTDLRDSISRSVMNSEEFRAGVIYGATNQFSRLDPVVDICLYKNDPERGHMILLGQKTHELEVHRLPGGHIEATDISAEAAARRELLEETGLTGEDFNILDHVRVTSLDAPGYAMFTTLFLATYTQGAPQPGSDMARLSWVELDYLMSLKYADNHEGLVTTALATIQEF